MYDLKPFKTENDTTNVKIPTTIVSPANFVAVPENDKLFSVFILLGINRPKFTEINNFVPNLIRNESTSKFILIY